MKSLIHNPEGVRDIYGKEYKRKLYIEDKIDTIIKRYGYEDIQTPGFEYFDVFSKEIGTTASKELYKFFDKEGNTLVLRPDFTPSIARCVAKYYASEENSIRLSYLGNTYTNTSDLQGKLKEVTEMGVELINDNSVEADAEMIAIVVDSLLEAGLHDFQISIGESNYFKGLCNEANLSEETEMTLRDYISIKNEFGAREFLADSNINEELIQKLTTVFELFGQTEMLELALKGATNPTSRAACERLIQLHQILCRYGIQKYATYDLGMLSKYRYYTGVIFKGFTYGVGDAIVKGGRYDNLLEKFGKESPAIGFVILIDDLMLALSRQNIQIEVSDDIEVVHYTSEDYTDKLQEAIEKRKSGRCVRLVRSK